MCSVLHDVTRKDTRLQGRGDWDAKSRDNKIAQPTCTNTKRGDGSSFPGGSDGGDSDGDGGEGRLKKKLATNNSATK